jgi:hypothetical protein
VIGAEGFDGSYQSLTSYVRAVRGPTRGKEAVVTMPIETGPAEEYQFDWSDGNRWARRWGWDHELHCFGTVACGVSCQELVVRRLDRPTPHP